MLFCEKMAEPFLFSGGKKNSKETDNPTSPSGKRPNLGNFSLIWETSVTYKKRILFSCLNVSMLTAMDEAPYGRDKTHF